MVFHILSLSATFDKQRPPQSRVSTHLCLSLVTKVPECLDVTMPCHADGLPGISSMVR